MSDEVIIIPNDDTANMTAILSRYKMMNEWEYARTGTGNDDELLTFGPGILTQAVILPVEKRLEGQLVQALAIPWLEILRLIEKDPTIIYQIDPRKWEEIIAAAYDRQGFDEVILTPRSGDLGRDVIAVKRGFGSVKFIEDVKTYKPGHLVKAEQVRALGFVLQSDRNASKGIVTTTSAFAPKIEEDEFIKPFLPTRIELIDGTKLIDRIAEWTKPLSSIPTDK